MTVDPSGGHPAPRRLITDEPVSSSGAPVSGSSGDAGGWSHQPVSPALGGTRPATADETPAATKPTAVAETPAATKPTAVAETPGATEPPMMAEASRATEPATVSVPDETGAQASEEIATLDAASLSDGRLVPEDPRTGEPRRPVAIILSTVACWLAVAVAGGSLLWIYWNAVPIEGFAQASWLMGQFVTEPGSLERVLLAVAVTVIGIVIGVANAIVGYYAWVGYRWTRIAGLISAGLSFGALTLNQPAWVAIPLAVFGAALLWLPPARRFFATWQLRRHPDPVFAPPTTNVYYGPLPRYR